MAKKKSKKRKPKRAPAPQPDGPSSEPPDAPEPAPKAPSPTIDARQRAFAYACLGLVCAIAFSRGLGFGLLDGWDDDRFLLNDALVQEPSFAHFVAIFSEPHFEAYHPLHLLSYWIDVPWLGLEGPGLHAVNLALWLLAGFAALEAAWALGLGFWGGVLATGLVLAHPVQVEAVTWVTGRKDILALGFGALAVWAHCRSARPFDRARLLSVLAFGAAALSKTTVLPLPLVLVAADVWLRDRDARAAVIAQAPTLIIALGLGISTVLIWQDNEMIRGRELSFAQHVALVGATLSHALATAAWPTQLSPLYPIERGDGFGALEMLVGPTIVALALVVGVRRKMPGLLFAAAGFVLLWLPTSNVLPLYFQWQDRYVSLPIWPLALGIGLAVDRLESQAGFVPRIAVAALVLGLAGRTAQYVGVWSDPVTLFGHAASTHPDSFYAWLNLGHARVKVGQLASAQAAYERAVETESLVVGHAALFRATLLRDERDRSLSPSRADELAARFATNLDDAEALRGVALDLAEADYRRGVRLALTYSFAIAPLPNDTLERAALVQLQRGNEWLARFYVSLLTATPIHPLLQSMYVEPEDEQTE